MSLFNLPQPARMHRVPMQILGAEHDALIPPDQAHDRHDSGRRAEILPGMGHGMMLEHDWEIAAMRIADWLAERAL